VSKKKGGRKKGTTRTVRAVPQSKGRKKYTTGREIDLYDIVYILYIPEGNPCNLKNKSTKILSPILAKKKTKSLIPKGIFSGPQTLREMFPNAP